MAAKRASDGKVYATGGSGKKYVYNPQTGNVMVNGKAVTKGSKDYNATMKAIKNDGVNLSGSSSGSKTSGGNKTSGSGSSGGSKNYSSKKNSGSGGQNNGVYDTDYHQMAIDAAKRYGTSGDQSDWQAVLDYMNARDQKIQAGGIGGVKSSIDILAELAGYKDAGDIVGYQQMIKEQIPQPTPVFTDTQNYDIAEKIAGQLAALDYDKWTEGEQYQSLADRMGYQGNMSMQDVLGQIASRTGGLASSYAVTAAQQQYNDYMARLEEVARQQYAEDRGDLRENADLALSMGDRDYQRFLDQRNQTNTDRSYALDVINNLLGYSYQDKADRYNQGVYEDETAYQREQARRSEAQNRIYDYLVNQGGSVGGLNPDLITASGYTSAELAAMAAQYQRQFADMPQVSGSGTRRSSGSSYSGSGSAQETSSRTTPEPDTNNGGLLAADLFPLVDTVAGKNRRQGIAATLQQKYATGEIDKAELEALARAYGVTLT